MTFINYKIYSNIAIGCISSLKVLVYFIVTIQGYQLEAARLPARTLQGYQLEAARLPTRTLQGYQLEAARLPARTLLAFLVTLYYVVNKINQSINQSINQLTNYIDIDIGCV